jgi:hypothetical protein
MEINGYIHVPATLSDEEKPFSIGYIGSWVIMVLRNFNHKLLREGCSKEYKHYDICIPKSVPNLKA